VSLRGAAGDEAISESVKTQGKDCFAEFTLSVVEVLAMTVSPFSDSCSGIYPQAVSAPASGRFPLNSTNR
jgi:hypothetical protein